MTTTEPSHPRRRGNSFYGRRRGRSLRISRAEALATLPEYGLQLPADQHGFTPGELLGPDGMFGRPMQDLWLEIGFGNGEHTLHIARENPDIGIIGFEPFLNGVSFLLRAVREANLDNVRVHADDARLLLPYLPSAVVGRVYIQFPDPWPKSRHHRRRLIQTSLLDRLAGLLRPGGELRLATDDPDLANWMMERTWRHPAFVWQARQAGDWREPPADWSPTRYYTKAVAAGRTGYFLNFTRRAADTDPS